MTARLTLICHAATAAVRLERFPADEDLDSDDPAVPADWASLKAARWQCAPELRTRRTALFLAGREVEIESGLHDWNLGTWAGRTLQEMAATDPAAVATWLSDPSAAPHCGESLDALIERVASVMAVAAARRGRLAAVTHPAVVRAAIVSALGAGSSAFWHIDTAPLARARLSHDGRRWTLQAPVPARSPSPLEADRESPRTPVR